MNDSKSKIDTEFILNPQIVPKTNL